MAGKIQFVNDIYNVSEAGIWLNGKPQVERTQDFTGAVTVRISVSSASKTGNKATKDSDFTVPSQLLTWNDGELGSKEVNLSILQDNILETDEIFLLSLTKITNAEYGDRKKCTIIINDDDVNIPISSSGGTITIGNDYPTIPPTNIGDIFISEWGSTKQFAYIGYDNNGTLAWKRISTSPIREIRDPNFAEQGDFTGQIWVNVTNAKAFVYAGNNWVAINNFSESTITSEQVETIATNKATEKLSLALQHINSQRSYVDNTFNDINSRINSLEFSGSPKYIRIESNSDFNSPSPDFIGQLLYNTSQNKLYISTRLNPDQYAVWSEIPFTIRTNPYFNPPSR